MSSELKDGAFRVFDSKLGHYDEGDGRNQWFLYGDGRLFLNYIYGADEENPLMQFDEADATRYTVERWTGLQDMHKVPIYEGDRIKILRPAILTVIWDRGEFTVDQEDPIYLREYADQGVVVGTIHDSEGVANG